MKTVNPSFFNCLSSIRLATTLIAAALLSTSFTSPSAAVVGKVVNQTASEPIVGLDVSLVVHAPDTAATLKTVSGSDGAFRFDAGEVDAAAQLFLTAHFDHVDYEQPVDFASDEPVTFALYERTESDSAVSIGSHHVILDTDAREIIHVLIAHNSGKRTFQTGEGHGHGLEVTLSEGATEVLGGPEGVHTHGSTLIDPRPVRPGASQLMYTLRMPDDGRFEQQVSYRTDNIDVLILPPEAEIGSTTLQDLGQITFNGKSFRRLTATGLVPGDRFSLQLGSDSEWILWSQSGPFVWVIGGAGVGILLILFWLRPRRTLTSAPPAPGNLQARRDALVEAIANLDDRLDDGDLSEADHKVRRDALKDELIRVTGEIEG